LKPIIRPVAETFVKLKHWRTKAYGTFTIYLFVFTGKEP